MKTHKKLAFELYMLEPASKRFKSFENNKVLRTVFDYLAQVEQVDKIIAISHEGRPGLEAIIEEVEDLFPKCEAFDLEWTYRHRQIMGSMVRFIMGHYGYRPGKAKSLKKGKYIKTGIVFYR